MMQSRDIALGDLRLQVDKILESEDLTRQSVMMGKETQNHLTIRAIQPIPL